MRLSLSITNYSWPGPTARLPTELVKVAHCAEEGGLDTIWVNDHLLQADPASSPDAEMLEAYSTLGYLAARTERIRLGAMVSPVTFRPPAVLIKAVTTLDVLSGGRMWLGLGAGYQGEDARAMDLPLPSARERFERLEETLRLAVQMWSDSQPAPFEGTHYRLAHPVSNPAPLSRPHPPILIGGMGEQRTLRLVASYADACNLFDIPDEGATVKRKLAVLAEHCAQVGRPFNAIEKTISTRFTPAESPAQFAHRLEQMTAWGLDHAVVITSRPWTEHAVTQLVAAAAQAGMS
jgi:F420-dependent oxidoreductase-like protein